MTSSQPPSNGRDSSDSSALRRSSSSDLNLAPGTIYVDKYEVISSIGGGASGHVYAAKRLSDGMSCALKILHKAHVGNRQPVERFRREAKILAQLAGPHIVRVHDFGEDPAGRLYLALDYASGVVLSRLLQGDELFTLEQVFDIMGAICEALDEAHSQQVIHRDLKPDNVIVDMTDGKVNNVFVLDFGLSKMLNERRPGSTNLTEQNMLLGTPEYMSPEQVRGDKLDERCDIYAAGVILYHLLYGRPPFGGSKPLPIMTAHMTQQPELHETRPDGSPVPPALLAVLRHSLAKKRNNRYPTARKMFDALHLARTRPNDMTSVRPPPPEQNDVAFSTTLSMEVPDSRPSMAERRQSTIPPVAPTRASGVEAPQSSRLSWGRLLVLVGVGLLGLTVGVVLALNL